MGNSHTFITPFLWEHVFPVSRKKNLEINLGEQCIFVFGNFPSMYYVILPLQDDVAESATKDKFGWKGQGLVHRPCHRIHVNIALWLVATTAIYRACTILICKSA